MSVKLERKLFQLEQQVKQLEARLASKTMEAEVLLKENKSLKSSLRPKAEKMLQSKGSQVTTQKKSKRRTAGRLAKD